MFEEKKKVILFYLIALEFVFCMSLFYFLAALDVNYLLLYHGKS